MSSFEYDHDFKVRKLYEQKSVVEETKQIHSVTYACSYQYPGSISKVTCRARLTLIFEYDYQLIVNGGTIEKWSDQGWQTIEEFFDTTQSFTTSDDAINHMLNMFKSFTLGVSSFDEVDFDDKPPKSSAPNKPGKKKPKMRVLSFKNKNEDKSDIYKYLKDDNKNLEDVNDYKDLKKDDKKDKDSDDDDPDFDWI